AAELADGGTLFLDELCEMDLDLQTKLLRFIQTGTFQKVGSSKMKSVDVRFVCATNRDPWKEVQEGRFREDLYYRLYVIPLHLPPLRERGEDVIEIAYSLLGYMSHEEGKSFIRFAPDVIERFN
ncbi:sigma 54-interacting transcriptional regulator, partial [Vibrio alginolyticus]